jgi:hypothetical protein
MTLRAVMLSSEYLSRKYDEAFSASPHQSANLVLQLEASFRKPI